MWHVIETFLGNKAEATRNGYKAVLREYFRFLGGDFDKKEGKHLFLKATIEVAARYLRYVKDKKGQSPRTHSVSITAATGTVRYKLATLTSFYNLLIRSKKASYNPFSDCCFDPLRKQRTTKRPTEMIPIVKVEPLIYSPDPKTVEGIRDRALLAVLFGGALRRGEAAALKISDVKVSDKGTMYLRLRITKSGCEQIQALPKWAAKLIKILLKSREKQGASPSDPLFAEHYGASMTAMSVYRRFKAWCFVMGLGSHITPHSARATAITKLLIDGTPYREVQAFSRHANVQTVEAYDKRRLSIDKSAAIDLNFSSKKKKRA